MSDHKDSLPKVPQQIGDPINENLQKLAQLFPGVVKDGELDVEALREELGDFAEIQPGDEKYELNWAGKQAAKKKAFEPLLGKTLKYLPDDSKQPDTTENIYLEGDNLEGLKLIRPNYYGAISIIYIDPPYNTGNDFVYKDNFKISAEESEQLEGARSKTGERLFKNENTSNRYHANWLDMMYPRLKLAKDLMKEDGVIFISIDDHEVHNLREVGDEIFGAENFINTIAVENNPKGRKNSKFVSVSSEHLLIYSKNRSKTRFIESIPKDPESVKKDESGRSFTPGKRVLVGKSSNLKVTNFNSDKHYSIYYKSNKDFKILKENKVDSKNLELINSGYKRYISSRDNNFIENTYTSQQFIDLIESNALLFKPDSVYEKDFNVNVRVKSMLKNEKSKGIDLKTETARSYIDKEIAACFDNPKNPIFLRLLISLIEDKDILILDFFSGSATTAHAVMQLNAEDGGSRKYIMVQLAEACDPKSEAAKGGYTTIAEIGKERIRRAGEKIVAELHEKKAALEKKGELALDDDNEQANPYLANPDALDIGFKSFRIEDTKINWLKKDLSGGELVDTDISDKDRLDFVPGFTDLDVVYEIMLRQSSIPLTEPICTLTDIGARTYLYGESYLICLEEDITKEMVEKLAQLEPTPLKFIFRDSAFGKDIAFKDTTFRRLNAEIAKHTEGEETYTVEFI